MYATTPESFKKFSLLAFKNLNSQKWLVLPEYVIAMVLNISAKTTLTALGRSVFSNARFKTTVSKFFRGKYLHTEVYLKDATRFIIEDFARVYGKKDRVILVLDGCCMKRGADTRIGNATQYRVKQTSSKGRSTKSHMFLMGVILLPNGMRLPAPRFTFYTKSYCRQHNIKFKTQHQLAAEMVKAVRGLFPGALNFIVLADGFFDSKGMFSTCRQVGATYIVPADSRRVYTRNGKRRNLHERAANTKANCKTFRIRKGEEKYTREHMRFAGGSEAKKIDTYRAISEELDVSGIGLVRALFSWKMKSRKLKYGRSSFKALLCNNRSLCDREILELYALRWQVEIFFRELKSDLGMADFSGQDFRAFERFIDMILMAYLYLEWYRQQLLEGAKSNKEKGQMKRLRTRGLICAVREEAFAQTIQYYEEAVA